MFLTVVGYFSNISVVRVQPESLDAKEQVCITLIFNHGGLLSYIYAYIHIHIYMYIIIMICFISISCK